MVPFFVVKSEVVPFFVVKWPPNLIGIAMLKGKNCSESDEKLVPNIIDKNISLVWERNRYRHQVSSELAGSLEEVSNRKHRMHKS